MKEETLELLEAELAYCFGAFIMALAIYLEIIIAG